MTTLSEAIRLAIGAVLLLAGIQKLRDPFRFVAAIHENYSLGRTAALCVGLAVMTSEPGLGLCHIAGLAPVAAPLMGAFLFSSFGVATAWLIARGENAPCMCFSVSDTEPATARTVARSAFAALGEVSLILGRARSTPGGDELSVGAIVWSVVVVLGALWAAEAVEFVFGNGRLVTHPAETA